MCSMRAILCNGVCGEKDNVGCVENVRSRISVLSKWAAAFAFVALLLSIVSFRYAFAEEIETDPGEAEATELQNADPAFEEECQEAEAERAMALAERTATSSDIPAFTLGFSTASGSPVVLSPQKVSEGLFFFLPSGARLTDVVVSFRAPENATFCILRPDDSRWIELAPEHSVDLMALLSEEAGNEFSFTMGLVSEERVLAVAEYRLMQSGNIASVFLTSADPENQGRDYIDGSPDHTTKAAGSIRVLSHEAKVRYSGEFSAIKGRGNTSWTAASKKSYQVKLDKKGDLLSAAQHGWATEKAKKWLLIGNPFDPTLMRNEVTYQLAKDIGMPAAVDAEAVDLYYDGEYRGSYLLTEKVEIGEGRVDIDDLEEEIEAANPGVDLDDLPTMSGKTSYGTDMQYVSGIIDPAVYTGGYLLELDEAFYMTEKSWFTTSSGLHFVSKSPEYLSSEQMRYISSLVNDAIECMSNGGRNPRTGKQLFDYFD